MEIFTKINWVDVLIVIVLLRISYVAFQEGLSHEIFPLIGSITTISLALHYYRNIAQYISQNTGWIPLGISALSAFITLIAVVGFIFKLLKVVLDKIIKVSWHPLIERFGGLIAGAIRASIAVSIMLMILVLMPFSYLKWSVEERSLTGRYFLKLGAGIHERTMPFMPSVRMPATDTAAKAGSGKA